MLSRIVNFFFPTPKKRTEPNSDSVTNGHVYVFELIFK